MAQANIFILAAPCPNCGTVWGIEDPFSDIDCDCGAQLRLSIENNRARLVEIHTAM